jgi:Tfp pilus assembly protein FimT
MRKHSAITFIELLIVVVIIAVLSAISIPNLKKISDNFTLDNFAKDIFYLCRYLQASAASRQKVYALNVNFGEGALQGGYKNEKGEFVPEEGRLGRLYAAPRGVTITTSPQVTTVYFYPDGSMSEAAFIFENSYGHKVSLNIKGASGGIKIE